MTFDIVYLLCFVLAVRALYCPNAVNCNCECRYGVGTPCNQRLTLIKTFNCTQIPDERLPLLCTGACVQNSNSGVVVFELFNGTQPSIALGAGSFGGNPVVLKDEDAFDFDPAKLNWALFAAVENSFRLGQEFSFGFWLLTSSAGPSNVTEWFKMMYVVFADEPDTVKDFGLVIGGDGRLVFGARDGNVSVVHSKSVNDNQWHHVVCTFNSMRLLALFVDGGTPAVSMRPVTGTGVLTNAQRVLFGGRGPGNPFRGQLAKVFMLYERALSADDVRAMALESRRTSTIVSGRCVQNTGEHCDQPPPPTPAPTPMPPPPPEPDILRCPLILPDATLDLGRFDCQARLASFSLNCGQRQAAGVVPSMAAKFATIHTIGYGLNRCPRVELRLDVHYELHLSVSLRAALTNADLAPPSGIQTFSHTTVLEGADIEVPIWPMSGVRQLALASVSVRVGIAAVIKNMRFRGASITFRLALRACAGLAIDCIDVDVTDDLTFGNDSACCVPEPLQCDEELMQCAARRIAALEAANRSVPMSLRTQCGYACDPGLNVSSLPALSSSRSLTHAVSLAAAAVALLKLVQ